MRGLPPVRGARRGARPSRLLGHAPRPGPGDPGRRRTRRRIRPDGQGRGHRAQRPAHPRQPPRRRGRRRGAASPRCTRSASALHGTRALVSADPRRIHVNLPSSWKAWAAPRRPWSRPSQGIDLCRKYGLADTEAWVQANEAESLFSLGRWDEATRPPRPHRRWSRSARKPRAGAARRRPSSPSAAAICPRPPPNSPPPAPTTAPTTRMPQYTCRCPPSPSASPRSTRPRIGHHRRPRRARPRHRHGLPAGHPALRLAAAARRRRRRGRHPRPARRRARPRRRPRAHPRGRQTPRHSPMPVWAAYERVGPRRTAARRGRDTPADWSAVGHRPRPPRPPLRPRPRPPPPGRGPPRHLLATGREPPTRTRPRRARLLRQAHEVAERLGARPLPRPSPGSPSAPACP